MYNTILLSTSIFWVSYGSTSSEIYNASLKENAPSDNEGADVAQSYIIKVFTKISNNDQNKSNRMYNRLTVTKKG